MIQLGNYGQLQTGDSELIAGDTASLTFIYENGMRELPPGFGVFIIFPTYWFYGVRTAEELGSGKKDNFYYITYRSHKYFQKADPCAKGYIEVKPWKNTESEMLELEIISYPWDQRLRFRNIIALFVHPATGKMLPANSIFFINFHNITVPPLAGNYSLECGIAEGIDKKVSTYLPLTIAPNGRVVEEEIFIPSNAESLDNKKIRIGSFDKFGNLIEKRIPKNFANSGLPEGNAGSWFMINSCTDRQYSRAALNNSLGYKLYWGDLHSHTEMSGHACGTPEDVLNYAQKVSELDFYAQIDHLEIMTETDRKKTLSLMENNNEPGSFVTFNGYEYKCEGRGENHTDPASHFNFYFRNAEDYFIPELNNEICLGGKIPVDELLTQISEKSMPGKTIVAGHQLGENCSCVTWNHPETPFEPFLEIYSHHGTSEFYNPDDSLYYNNVHIIDYENKNHNAVYGPHYARDAWANGRKLGVIAASDGHIGKPGVNSWGLTGIYCESLDRDAVFDAFLQRRTYATTGERIILYLKVNGRFMGETFSANTPEAHIEGEVFGTARINCAEIVRLDISARVYSVISRLRPDPRNPQYLRINLQDELKSSNQMYFIRIFQSNTVRGRAVRAWSSPVWINYE